MTDHRSGIGEERYSRTSPAGAPHSLELSALNDAHSSTEKDDKEKSKPGKRPSTDWCSPPCFEVRWFRVDTTASEDGNLNASASNNQLDESPLSYYGVFATRDIPPRTLILQDGAPLLFGESIWNALHGEVEGRLSCRGDDDDYLSDECGMSEDRRNRLWELHDQRNPDGEKRLSGIIKSNGFCNSDFGMEPFLFGAPVSRFNHSCAPNAGLDFSGKRIRIFVAGRPVAEGDELTLCYSDSVFHHSAAVRVSFLEHKLGFRCACSACSCVGNDGLVRRRIGLLAEHLVTHVGGLSGEGGDASFLYNEEFERGIASVRKETPNADSLLEPIPPPGGGSLRDQRLDLWDKLLEYLRLLEEERLDHDMLQCYELAFDWASLLERTKRSGALPDTSSMLRWGRETLALYELHKGSHHTNTRAFKSKLFAQLESIE